MFLYRTYCLCDDMHPTGNKPNACSNIECYIESYWIYISEKMHCNNIICEGEIWGDDTSKQGMKQRMEQLKATEKQRKNQNRRKKRRIKRRT